MLKIIRYAHIRRRTYVLGVFLVVRHLDSTSECDLGSELEPFCRQQLLPVLIARQMVTVHGDLDILRKGCVKHFVESFLVGGSEQRSDVLLGPLGESWEDNVDGHDG